MNSTLTFALVQADIHWEKAKSNLIHYEKLLHSLSSTPDVIIFPEMFNTGFSVKTTLWAESLQGESVDFLHQCAKRYNAAVVASMAIKEENKFYNSLLWIMPDGTQFRYDKRHLFRMGFENELFTKGNKRLVVSYKGWHFLPLICYDIRFPIWCRNKRQEDTFLYDCLICIANWPASRMSAFDTLLTARAIENQSFAIMVNRTGEDGNKIIHSGGSKVVSACGKILTDAGNKEKTVLVSLDKNDLDIYRNQFPASLDWENNN